MDRFYLDNAALFQNLVKSFNPTHESRIATVATETTSPNLIVSARIRPLLNEDVAAVFPCAVFPRPARTGVVDLHDLYNHPRGRPVLKVRKNNLHSGFIYLLVSHTNISYP
jgi:kinesin family protein 2/24